MDDPLQETPHMTLLIVHTALYIGKNISPEIVFRFFRKNLALLYFMYEQRIELQTATHCGN